MPKFGDIVLIPFPFTDLSSSKLRPALVISEKISGDDIIVAFISSKIKADKYSIKIEPSMQEFENSGLKISSTIRLNKIATLSKKIIIGKLGFLTRSFLKSHSDKFMTIFGF